MRVRNSHAANVRMGERASHERHVLHAGEMKVRHELAAATHQAVVFFAEKACTDALLFHLDHSRAADCIRSRQGSNDGGSLQAPRRASPS
jgi:ribonucleotide monophosphatase NagD (HAD superfamily)